MIKKCSGPSDSGSVEFANQVGEFQTLIQRLASNILKNKACIEAITGANGINYLIIAKRFA